MIAVHPFQRLNSDTLTIAEQQLDDSARRFYALSLCTLIQPAQVYNFFFFHSHSAVLRFIYPSFTDNGITQWAASWVEFWVFFSVRHCCPQHRLSALLFFFLSVLQFCFDRHREQSSWVFVAILTDSDSELVLCKKKVISWKNLERKFSKSRRRSMIACEWISDQKKIIFWRNKKKRREKS